MTAASTASASQGRVGALLDDGLRMLVTTIVDNAGITRAKTVPAGQVGPAARDGIGLSPVFAVMCTDDFITSSSAVSGPVGDLRLIPDLAAAVLLDPDGGLAWAPADQRDQEHQPVGLCQRTALRRQEQCAVSRGLAFRLGFELEFTLFRGDPDEPVLAHAGPAYGLIPTLALEGFAGDLFAALEAARLPVQQLHPEYGPGQVEVTLAPTTPVEAADRAVLARMIIHRVAARHDLRASFAPITVPGNVGNGAHLHFSAETGGVGFGGGDGPCGLTVHARQMIAGVLAELEALNGLLASSVLSAERLVPGNWAGAHACWGPENREAALRYVPGSVSSRPGSANCEIKIGDASANPYLAAAAVLACAMTGLDRALPLPDPVDHDPAGYSGPERARLGIRPLPSTPDAALTALEASAVLRDALGDALLDSFLAVRRHDASTLGTRSLDERVHALRWRY